MPEPGLHPDEAPDGTDVGLQQLLVKDMDVPCSVADSKEGRLQFLKGLCQEPTYEGMVNWLDANLVPYSLTLTAIATADVESRAQQSS